MLRKTMLVLCLLALSAMIATSLQAAGITYLYACQRAADDTIADMSRWMFDPANPNVGVPAPGLGLGGSDFSQVPLTYGAAGLAVGANGDLYVVMNLSNQVVRIDTATGTFKSVFLSGIPGMSSINVGPDGNFYITRYAAHVVERYAQDGTPMPAPGQTGAIFAARDEAVQDVPMADPDYCGWGPDGYLYVAAETTHRVYRFNPTTGAADAATFAAGPDIFLPTGLMFGPNNNLFVASAGGPGWGEGNGYVLQYNATTGEYIGKFSDWCDRADKLTLGPNGNLFATRYGNKPISQIDKTTGADVGDFVPAANNGGMYYDLKFITLTAVGGEVDATVTLADFVGDIAQIKSCVVELLKADGAVQDSRDIVPTSTTVEAKFYSVPAGSYTVRASALKWLSRSEHAVVTEGGVTPVAIELPNGDCNGDGAVGLLDLGVLKKGWGQSGS